MLVKEGPRPQESEDCGSPKDCKHPYLQLFFACTITNLYRQLWRHIFEEKSRLEEALLLCNGVLDGFLGQTEKKLKKYEKDHQHFDLRNALYCEGWECESLLGCLL